ncbi:MAG: serpin family protein [Simkania sp.]|nr:serpin family protein [Simkania sp.]
MFLSKLFLSTALTTTLLASTPEHVDSKTAVDSLNAFGIDLLTPMTSNHTNAVYSPSSLFISLSMVASGANGTTLQSMKKGLHWSGDTLEIAQSIQCLSKQLSSAPTEKNCLLTCTNVNGLFAEQDTSFLPSFQKTVEDYYQANLQSMNFSLQVQATDIINTWISNSTHGKIPRLLQLGDVDSSTRLALVDAVYFSGQWVSPFSKEKTTKQPFITDPKKRHDVSMMRQVGSFSFLEQSSTQILALPFKACSTEGPQPLLLIVLPPTFDDLKNLQKQLTPDLIQQWLSELKPQFLDVQLPNFCLRKRYDMQQPLKALGMAAPFMSNADFSGIDGSKDLFLSKAIHEAYFHLDEQGVEASAASIATFHVTATGPSKESPIAFTANHPFLFLLIDQQTSTLLFLGEFVDPSLTGCN